MLLVAVSGGIDSICLAEKVRLEGGPFAIAHCNFGLRGSESDGDEAFVREWAGSHGVTCHVKRFDTKQYASDEGISIEMAARRLRYRWFGQLCREFGYSGVAVAHNANDNAETLLLNLLRGTGVRGILGMKENGFIPDPEFGDIPLVRPLLGMTRDDLNSYAKEHGLSWREDSTNAINDYKRNKLRNLVFPVFKEINPRFIETLNRDMERFADELEEQGNKDIQVPGTESFCPPRSYIIETEPWDGTQPVKQEPGQLILDADKAGEYVTGHWESGDWIRPLGAPGKKKLQDWFTDHHIEKAEKHSVLLLRKASDLHHIIAVAGHCIDNSVKVDSSTERILRILPNFD